MLFVTEYFAGSALTTLRVGKLVHECFLLIAFELGESLALPDSSTLFLFCLLFKTLFLLFELTFNHQSLPP